MKACAFSIKGLVKALHEANAAYRARQGDNANLDKDGLQPDCKRAIKMLEGFTQAQVDAVNALEFAKDFSACILNATNVKVAMRAIYLAGFVATRGDKRYVAGSVKTYLKQLWATVEANAKTRDALKYAATGKGNEHTSDEINIERTKPMRSLGNVAVGSESTQYSVSWSQNGLATIGKVANRTERNACPVPMNDSPMIPVLLDILREMGEAGRAQAFAGKTDEAQQPS